MTGLLLAQAAPPPTNGAQLVLAALIGIAVIVVLITRYSVHPFLSLTIGSLVTAAVAGQGLDAAITSYSTGFGRIAAGVGTLIALGAMFGKLLADSGGADQIVDTIVGRSSTRMLPWSMALVGAIIGLPMFFEIGLVLLMPVIFLVSRRSGLSLMKIGIPAWPDSRPCTGSCRRTRGRWSPSPPSRRTSASPWRSACSSPSRP